MRNREIDVNVLLNSEVLRGWGVNDKTGVDLSRNFFFLHLTSSHLESELLHILDRIFCSFCSALIPWFCSRLILNIETTASVSAIFPARLWLCPKKLLCIHCMKQLAKFPYCICRICSGQIFCLHCKKDHKKCRPVGVDVPTSKSWLT